jgi:phosphoglycolate phosphatase
VFERACRASIAELTAYPGVTAVLPLLRSQGATLGLVTSVPASFARMALESFGLLNDFTTLVAAKRGIPRKPSPAGIFFALRELGIEPTRRIWYVGDSNDDFLAATGAGISFAFASWGYGRLHEGSMPDRILSHPEECLEL